VNHSARSEAQALAGDLPGLLLDAERLAANVPGFHGRRRAGPGEAFWQYRDHRPEDGARAVDWRRSARGERYFVRERELEAAQTAWLWLDPDPGMDWRGGEDRPSKKRRALVILAALAILLTRAGERVGALGGATHAGPRAGERVLLDLAQGEAPVRAPTRARVIYASDFYAPDETWRARLAEAGAAGASGALLLVADPAEEDFPYQGRRLFRAPGGAGEALIGKAENARDAYLARLEAQRSAMRALGAHYGFPLVAHRTDHSAALALTLLSAVVSAPRR